MSAVSVPRKLLLALALSACASARPAAPAAPSPTTPAPALDASVVDASVAAAPVAPPAGCAAGARARREGERVFVVASDEGVREVAADGAVLRVLTRTAAARPRLVDGAVLFLATSSAEVRRVSRDDCREAVVAALPRGVAASCGEGFREGYDPTGFVQEDADARLTPAGDALCLRVRDRNANMVQAEVQLRVPLDGGAVTHAVVTSQGCGEVTGAALEALPCAAALRPRRQTPASGAWPWSLRGRRVAQGARAAATFGDDVAAEVTSPSGRWQVLSTNVQSGDYIHRDLLLLDRQSGRVLTLDAAPAALTAAQLRSPAAAHGRTLDATGESTVRFLDDEALLVDDALVTPGSALVRLGGHVAE